MKNYGLKGHRHEISDFCFICSFKPSQAPDSSLKLFSISPSNFQSYFKFNTTPREYAPPGESTFFLNFYKNFSFMIAYIKEDLNLFMTFCWIVPLREASSLQSESSTPRGSILPLSQTPRRSILPLSQTPGRSILPGSRLHGSMLFPVIDSPRVCFSRGVKFPGSIPLGSLDSNLLLVSRFENFGLIPGRSILPGTWFPGGAYSQGVDFLGEHTPAESDSPGEHAPAGQTPRVSLLLVITSNLNNF